MKGGATEFLLKPFDEDDLVRAIDAAIAFDRRERERERERERKKVAFAISSHGMRRLSRVSVRFSLTSSQSAVFAPGLHAGT
jgi:FixJ family two-component response regulator